MCVRLTDSVGVVHVHLMADRWLIMWLILIARRMCARDLARGGSPEISTRNRIANNRIPNQIIPIQVSASPVFVAHI